MTALSAGTIKDFFVDSDREKINFASMRNQPILVIDGFTPRAKSLRRHFDDQFANPLSLEKQRFVWDYWHVPEQYTLVRTPAYHYFPQKMYMPFHKELVLWGRQNLGCWDISPPWLSYYVEGCEQSLHADIPHGPWAFVLSLSLKRDFRGGETLLLKESVLQYWRGRGAAGAAGTSDGRGLTASSGNELHDLVDLIEPKFNRLVVFDGRIPHGVRRVAGTHDPREARLVLHGWFSNPKTYIEGGLPGRVVERRLNEAFAQVADLVSSRDPVWGTLALRLRVSAAGRVTVGKYLTMSVRDSNGELPRELLLEILRVYRSLEFPRARTATDIVLPLLFE